MKILSIDTASNICGVSILEDTKLICRLDQDTRKTHSENLIPIILQAFKQANLTLSDIDLLVCDKGPGSFTGIRIGIATIKAFHDSLNLPCIGVSSLEALSYAIQKPGYIASILDCKNDNCYFALYELKNSKYYEIISPTAETIETALNLCDKKILTTSPITFVGDGSVVYQGLITNKFKKNGILAPFEANVLNSYLVGLAGFHKYKQNKSEDVLPLYLKKPQAQAQLEEKFKHVEIIPMTQEHLNQIANALTSDFDEFWNDSILRNELTAKNSDYFVAKWKEQIVGFAGIKTMLDEADLMNIVVRKDFRNQGIGTLLLKNLILYAKEKKLASINLEVMEENYSAIHLYKKLGFQSIGIRKNYYQDKNAIIMKSEIKETKREN